MKYLEKDKKANIQEKDDYMKVSGDINFNTAVKLLHDSLPLIEKKKN